MIAIEVLEKGRPSTPLGTRKQQQQKRMKNGKLVVTWMWVKKTYDGWKYDGMVSPAERKASLSQQKKVKIGQKKVEATKQKLEEIEQDIKNKDVKADKPDAATLAKAPTKVKLYWHDETTDEQRLLCDQTGILTRDKESYEYVKAKMGTVFQMDDTQKSVVENINPYIVLGSDGKAFDDPLFLEDTLVNLKAMKDKLLDKSYLEDMTKDNFSKMNYKDRQPFNGQESDYRERVRQGIENQFEERIEALEKNENDKILLNKLKAWDKGVRGFQNTENMHHVLIEGIFGDLSDVPSNPKWSEIPEKYKLLLSIYGIHETAWTERQWLKGDLRTFAMATLNDEFRTKLFEPWFSTVANVSYEQVFYQNYGTAYSTYLLRDKPERHVRVDPASLQEAADTAKSGINKLTLEFTNKAFRFQNIEFSTGGIASAIETEKLNADKVRIAISGGSTYAPRSSMVNTFAQAFETVNIYKGATGVDGPIMGVNPDMSWREFANSTKALTRRKEFSIPDHYKSPLDALFDAGKALGTTSFNDTAKTIERGFTSLYGGLSNAQKHWVKTPDEQKVERYAVVSKKVLSGSTYYSQVGYARDFLNSVDVESVNKDDSTSKNRGDKGLVMWGNFRKSPKGQWKAGRFEMEQVPHGGTAGPKGAMKSKHIALFGALDSNYDGSRRSTPSTIETHVDASIKLNVGMNWQLKELLKDQADVVPEWKWNPKFIPFGSKNDLSHLNGIRVNGYTHPDSLNKNDSINKKEVSQAMKEHYEASVASVLGLNANSVRTRTMPEIALKTNAEGAAGWQKKVDDSWTHDNQNISGYWQKGSMIVKHVFDIEYHDYYDKYKQLETARGNVHYGWHGTSFMAGAKIIKGGFKKGGGLLGEGQYIADSASKAGGYLAGGAGNWNRHGQKGVMFWNRCSFGRTNPASDSAVRAIRDPNVDTVFGPGLTGKFPQHYQSSGMSLQHDEWCVKDRAAVIPLQWVDVETV